MCVPIGASERSGNAVDAQGPTDNLLRSERGETARDHLPGRVVPIHCGPCPIIRRVDPLKRIRTVRGRSEMRFENDLCYVCNT